MTETAYRHSPEVLALAKERPELRAASNPLVRAERLARHLTALGVTFDPHATPVRGRWGRLTENGYEPLTVTHVRELTRRWLLDTQGKCLSAAATLDSATKVMVEAR